MPAERMQVEWLLDIVIGARKLRESEARLKLAAEGRLTGPFPYSAAWGDIITGVVAVPMLWLLKDGGARYTTAIAA